MKRRDLLLPGSQRDRVLEYSCEQLTMKYLDARAEGAVPQFLNRLSGEWSRARIVRLHDRSWLECGELRRDLEPLLREFQARGGRVEYA